MHNISDIIHQFRNSRFRETHREADDALTLAEGRRKVCHAQQVIDGHVEILRDSDFDFIGRLALASRISE